MTHEPPRRPRLLSPSTLEPVEIDLRKIFGAGIALWTVALVVVLVMSAAGQTTGRGIAVCGAGIVLGLLGVLWEHRRRRRGGTTPTA